MKPRFNLTSLACLLAGSIAFGQAPVRTTRDMTITRTQPSNPPNPLIWDVNYAAPEPGTNLLRLDNNYPDGLRLADIGHFVGTPLLAIGHITDPQIMDDESSLRVPFIDAYADDIWNPGYYTGWDTGSAYRPQEMLSTQIMDAMVRAIRNVGTGPVTGLPLQFTITTGDMADNTQRNEQQWAIRVMDGNTVTPKSGGSIPLDNGNWDWSPGGTGFIRVGDFTTPLKYWRPEDPGLHDAYKNHGFPNVPGIMGAARVPFQATGIGMPWYVGLGNHDIEVQGNASLDLLDGTWTGLAEWASGQIGLGTDWGSLNDIAVHGNRLQDVFGLPTNFNDLPDGITGWIGYAYSHGVGAKFLTFPGLSFDYNSHAAGPDPNRQLLNRAGIVNEYFNTNGSPAGHGFTRNQTVGYYAVPSGPSDLFQFIHLDSNNASGGAGGWIDNAQADWLELQLRACSSRYRSRPAVAGDPDSWVYQPGVKDKMVVLYCHHPLRSMNNVSSHLVQTGWGYPPEHPRDDNYRFPTYTSVPDGINGAQLEEKLLRFPNVVLVVNGHTHDNKIVGHKFPYTIEANQNGFFEVTTASVLDWPMQSRLIEFSKFANDLIIHTTMVDLDADLVPAQGSAGLSTPRQLATWGRWIAANDPQEHPILKSTGEWGSARSGELNDRNVQLALKIPFALPADAEDVGTTLAATSDNFGGIELIGLTPGSVSPTLPDSNAFYTSALPSDISGDRYLPTKESGILLSVAAGKTGLFSPFGISRVLMGFQSWGTIYYTTTNGLQPDNFIPWVAMNDQPYSFTSIALTNDCFGRLTIFGTRGNQNPVRRTLQDGGYTPTWSSWTSMPGGAVNVIAAGTNQHGAMQIFGISLDGNCWTRYQTDPYHDTWSGWTFMGSSLKAISATLRGDGRMELFAVDTAGHLLHRAQVYQDSVTNWGPWTNVTDFTPWYKVASATKPDGRVAIFGVTNANLVFSFANDSVSSDTYGSMTSLGFGAHK